MSKIKANIEPFEYFYKLIGIVTSLQSYRLTYFINSSLKINLKRIKDLEIDDKKKKKKYFFEQFVDENLNTKYFLFSNKLASKNLFSSYKGFDFVLLVKQDEEIDFIDKIVDTLKSSKEFKLVFHNKNLMKKDDTFIKKEILYREFDKKNKKPE